MLVVVDCVLIAAANRRMKTRDTVIPASLVRVCTGIVESPRTDPDSNVSIILMTEQLLSLSERWNKVHPNNPNRNADGGRQLWYPPDRAAYSQRSERGAAELRMTYICVQYIQYIHCM